MEYRSEIKTKKKKIKSVSHEFFTLNPRWILIALRTKSKFFILILEVLDDLPLHPLQFHLMPHFIPRSLYSSHPGLLSAPSVCQVISWFFMFIPVGRLFLQFSSVQLLSHVRSLWPHGLQHTRPACPSQTPRVYSNLCHWVGEGDGTPLQYSCLENPMDGGAWWAAVHGITRSRTRLSDFTFTFHFHAWEKEMATHSSVLAWRIPGKGEPGGLPSMGSHRVGHDWSD